MSLTHFDLFSGIGGFALAAKWAGFQTIGFCEIDPFCREVLRKNFPDVGISHNIERLRLGPIKDPFILDTHDCIDLKVTLITGGFPCQPFSQAGKKRGVNDERYLWPEMLRCIVEAQPNWCIIENVGGLVKRGLDTVIRELEDKDYTCWIHILPASLAKAPHRRDRVWIIAHNNSVGTNSRQCCWVERCLSENKDRYLAQIQQEWAQFIPYSWSTYKARDWIKYNARVSRGDVRIPSKLDKNRIKALGNAIVPQVVYPIMKMIRDMERGEE